MRLDQTGLPGGVLRVKLTGALDIAGAEVVDLPFNVIGGKYDRVIVDFSDVTFLASIGIRVLVKVSRAISNRKGRLVVYGVREEARKVLRSTGIDTIIPVAADEATAVAECTK